MKNILIIIIALAFTAAAVSAETTLKQGTDLELRSQGRVDLEGRVAVIFDTKAHGKMALIKEREGFAIVSISNFQIVSHHKQIKCGLKPDINMVDDNIVAGTKISSIYIIEVECKEYYVAGDPLLEGGMLYYAVYDLKTSERASKFYMSEDIPLDEVEF